MPLTFKETWEYIQHRIHIATARPGLKFTPAAFRVIYKYSGGLPRLINIVCDRALLTAFGYNQLKITGSIARGAVRELQGRESDWRGRISRRVKWFTTLGVVSLILLLIVLYGPRRGELLSTRSAVQTQLPVQPQVAIPAQSPAQGPETQPTHDPSRFPPKKISGDGRTSISLENISQAGEPVPPAMARQDEAVTDTAVNLAGVLQGMASASSRIAAAKGVLSLWGLGEESESFIDSPDEQTFFQLVCKRNNLLVHRLEGKLLLLQRLNLPAVLRFEPRTGHGPVYLALCGVKGDTATLCGWRNGFTLEVEAAELEQHWSGVAYVPWKNFIPMVGTIPEDADDDSVRVLKSYLREIGFPAIDETPYYDEQAKRAIVSIQEKYGIPADGVVGSITKIALYNEKKTLPIPRITRQ